MRLKQFLSLIIFQFIVSCSSLPALNKKTIVFIHGANFNASSWALLSQELNNFETYSINLPGRGDSISHKIIDLDYSADSLCHSLRKIDKEINVILHSQAGAIFNHSLAICPEVKISKVIYISAVVPLNGERVFHNLSKNDEINYFKGIQYDKKQSSLIITNHIEFIKSFASNASRDQKTLILASSVSEPALIGEGVVKLNNSKFYSLVKYYIKTINDKIISQKSQNEIIKGINFKSVYSIESEHLPMITDYQELSKIIEDIL